MWFKKKNKQEGDHPKNEEAGKEKKPKITSMEQVNVNFNNLRQPKSRENGTFGLPIEVK